MKLKLSIIKVFLSKNGNTFLSLAGLAFFARELGASQMGVFFLFQALINTVSLPTSLGIARAVEKHISTSENVEQYFVSSFAIQLVLIIIVIGMIFALSDRIINYLGQDLIGYLILGLILKALGELMFSALKGELRVGESASIKFGEQVVWISVSTGLLLSGLGLISLIIGRIAGFGIKLVWSAHKLTIGWQVLKHSPTKASIQSLFSFAGRNIFGELGPFLYSWVDIIILGSFVSTAQVGAYEIAWRVAGTANQLTQALTTTVFPQMSYWSKEDSVERIGQLLSKLVTPAIILPIPAFFGSILLSEEILSVVFGAEYAAAWLVLILFMMRQIIVGLTSILDVTLVAMDSPGLKSVATGIGIILNVIFNIILIRQFGLVGAAVATTLSVTVHSAFIIYFISDKVQLNVPVIQVGWCFVSSIGMILVLIPVYRYIQINTLTSLLAIVSLGAVVYGILIMFSSSIRVEIITSLTELLPSN